MKCPHCNTLNKEGAKFCKNCGKPINNESLAYKDKFGDSKVNNSTPVSSESSKSNSNILIICVTVIICAVIIAGAFVYINSNDSNAIDNSNNGESVSTSDNQSSDNSVNEVQSKSWKSIGSFSGSGTGLKSYSLPEGKIKVEISAHPIKNYATNHLYAYSTTGDSVGVDWGSKSAVETRSDSMTFDSTGGDTLDIDYYETVSWNVDIYQYS